MASVATASAASGATASQKREPRAGRRRARGTSIVATGELTRGVRRDAWPRRSSRPAPGTWGETGTRWWPGSGRGRSPRPDPARRRRPRGRRTTPARVGGTRDRTARTAGSPPRRTDCRAPPGRARSGDARTTPGARHRQATRRRARGCAAAHREGGQAVADGLGERRLQLGVAGEGGQLLLVELSGE